MREKSERLSTGEGAPVEAACGKWVANVQRLGYAAATGRWLVLELVTEDMGEGGWEVYVMYAERHGPGALHDELEVLIGISNV